MILKRLRIWHVGPFGTEAIIEIEPDITVLTGRNDTGKSTILNLIRTICTLQKIGEDSANITRRNSSAKPWAEDDEIRVVATFTLPNPRNPYIPGMRDLQKGSEVDISFPLAPSGGAPTLIGARHSNGSNRDHKGELKRMPKVLYLPLESEIRSEIKFSSINELEKRFLKTIFGANPIAKLEGLNPVNQIHEISRGEHRLTELSKDLLPESMRFEFKLNKIPNTDDTSLLISIRDQFNSYTPLHFRGSGVQKIVTLLAALFDLDLGSEHVYILFDEPENSLHADAQHALRKSLELLSKHESIQVIFATHSPSMINPARPQSIRLLERIVIDNRPTTKIDNKPYSDNYLPVRTSLGLSPIDSLLYSAITIIVEGDSEVLCMPILLQRLFEGSIPGFEKLDQIFPLIHFLNGSGSSFSHWCRLVKAQGAKPIIFVDSDMARQVEQQLDDEDVPIIILPEGQEFEDLVPKEIYFDCLAKITQRETSLVAFEEWQNNTENPPQMMFTKRVRKWLQHDFQTDLDKPRTMKLAVEKVDLGTVQLVELKQLLIEVKKLLNS